MKGLDWFWASSVSHPLIIAAPKGSSSIKRIPPRRVQTHLFASQYFHSIFYFFSLFNLQFWINHLQCRVNWFRVSISSTFVNLRYHACSPNICSSILLLHSIYNMQPFYLLPNFFALFTKLAFFIICNSRCATHLFAFLVFFNLQFTRFQRITFFI